MNALILKAPGTNRDLDVQEAIEQAGGNAKILSLIELRETPYRFRDFGLLVVPGGFSYGDALGAGRLLALDLSHFFADEVRRFVESGKPVLGICNGFQALVRAGILPGKSGAGFQFTLAHNRSGHFECRWVRLIAPASHSLWTKGIDEIDCPVAHWGGSDLLRDATQGLDALEENGCIALRYATKEGMPAKEVYPDNPNGSALDIAGICNAEGNVLGLMPHPENAVFAWQTQALLGRQNIGALRLFSKWCALMCEGKAKQRVP